MSELEGMNIETGDWVEGWESVKESSEEQQKKVSEDQKKAKQVKKQLQKTSENSQSVAKFLSLLFKKVQNDKIIFYIWDFLFKKWLNFEDLFIVFFPYVDPKSESIDISFVEKKKWKVDYNISNTVNAYSDYLKKYMNRSDILQKISKDDLKDFLKNVMFYFEIWEIKKSKEKNELQEFSNDLEQVLIDIMN